MRGISWFVTTSACRSILLRLIFIKLFGNENFSGEKDSRKVLIIIIILFLIITFYIFLFYFNEDPGGHRCKDLLHGYDCYRAKLYLRCRERKYREGCQLTCCNCEKFK